MDSHQHRKRINNALEDYLENASEKDDDEDEKLEYEYEIELEEEGSFEKQRKEVERQYFHKQGPPNIEWSDDDCQIDDSH